MRPLSTVEKPAFRALLENVAGQNIAFPGRRGVGKELEAKFDRMIATMKDVLSTKKFVSTSADIWSSRCASYLGKN